MVQKIRNIIFDMGGVLIDLDRERCVEAFRRIGFPQAEDMLSNYTQSGVFADLESGMIDPAQFYDHVRAQTGRDLPDDRIAAALNEFLVDLPVYKLSMMRHLRERFRIYLLSNTNAIMIPYIKRKFYTQEGLTFEDYFDDAFLSYEMGYIKPDPRIYQVMLDRSDIVPGESLFIDDGKANLEAAEKFGFSTYLARQGEDFSHIFDML